MLKLWSLTSAVLPCSSNELGTCAHKRKLQAVVCGCCLETPETGFLPRLRVYAEMLDVSMKSLGVAVPVSG